MSRRASTGARGTKPSRGRRCELLYWSGPRLYPWEWGYRWETRFPPVDARFVRITQHEQDPRFPWVIAEAYVYEDLGPGAGADAGEQDVLRRIRDLGLGRVYADRWMSAKIAESSHGRIETVTPFTIAVPEYYVRLNTRVIEWDAQTGFVLADADADEFERTMREEGVHHLFREDLGRWALFHGKGPSAPAAALGGDPGWWWNGLGVVRTDPKSKSRYLATLAQNADRDGSTARALLLSRQAVKAYPSNHHARRTLIHALEGQGRTAEAAEQSRILRDSTEPQVKTALEFQDTLELRGYTLGPEPARPGRDVKIRFSGRSSGIPVRRGRSASSSTSGTRPDDSRATSTFSPGVAGQSGPRSRTRSSRRTS